MADSGSGSVEPERCAQLVDPIGAQKSVKPFRTKFICFESMRSEIEASKKIVLKRRYMEYSSKLYRLRSLSINDRVENHSLHSKRIDDTNVS